MKIISVNVGMPRTIEYKDKLISTGIFKASVSGGVKVERFNLAGDGQADLRVHGGESKSVYLYPFEHYDFWRSELPETDLPCGVFGENLTTLGLSEETVFVGDKFQAGTAVIVITEPRFPCFKLGIRFNRTDIVKRFQESRRNGFYASVEQTGEVEAGDRMTLLSRTQTEVSIADLVRVTVSEPDNFTVMKRALQIESLPAHWKESFRKKLNREERN